MTKQIKQLGTLDRLFHVRPRSKNSGKRRVYRNGRRRDAVSRLLSQCQSPSEIGMAAVEFGLSSKEVIHRGKSAPNFGQFRMVIGNRMRGNLSGRILSLGTARL